MDVDRWASLGAALVLLAASGLFAWMWNRWRTGRFRRTPATNSTPFLVEASDEEWSQVQGHAMKTLPVGIVLLAVAGLGVGAGALADSSRIELVGIAVGIWGFLIYLAVVVVRQTLLVRRLKRQRG